MVDGIAGALTANVAMTESKSPRSDLPVFGSVAKWLRRRILIPGSEVQILPLLHPVSSAEERLSYKQDVVGSIPTPGTKKALRAGASYPADRPVGIGSGTNTAILQRRKSAVTPAITETIYGIACLIHTAAAIHIYHG